MATRKLKAASTHHMGEPELGTGDKEALNHQKPGVLIAPSPSEGRSTHSTQTAGVRRKIKALSVSDLANEDPDLDNFDPLDDLGNDDPDDLDLDLENSGGQSAIIAPDVNAAADDEDEDDLEDDSDDLDQDDDDDLDQDDDDEDDDESTEAEVMDIVDVDNMPEEVDESEINVAPLEASLLVLRGSRVIATMTKAEAEEEGVGDEFQSDEFAEVVASVCATKGLRRGLAELGFRMATVNLGASHIASARVRARAEKVTAKVNASAKQQSKHIMNCLALAAVGLNKGFWKDVPNSLKESVEAALLHAGVANPKTSASRLFAKAGIEYAKSMVTIAQRLAAMPESTRNTLAEALDFTNDEVEEDEEVDGEAVDVDDDAADFEDIDASTIEAALSKPGRKQQAALLAPKTPVTARAYLEGSDILEF